MRSAVKAQVESAVVAFGHRQNEEHLLANESSCSGSVRVQRND